MARTTLPCHNSWISLGLERYPYPILRTNSKAEFVEKQRGQPKFGCPGTRQSSLVLKPLTVVRRRGCLPSRRLTGARSLPRGGS